MGHLVGHLADAPAKASLYTLSLAKCYSSCPRCSVLENVNRRTRRVKRKVKYGEHGTT
jgi:hypothetical protein